MTNKEFFGGIMVIAALVFAALVAVGISVLPALFAGALVACFVGIVFGLYMLARVEWWFRKISAFHEATSSLCNELIDHRLPWRDYYTDIGPSIDDVERYFWRWDFDSFARNRELYEDVLRFRDTGELPDRFAKAA